MQCSDNCCWRRRIQARKFHRSKSNDKTRRFSVSIHHCKKRRMFYANSMTTGGYINSETKLAITLRFMAGGSFLDIAALYCCGYTHANEIFHTTIERWICNDEVIKFEGLDYLDNVPLILGNAKSFSSTGCHQGVFSGVIGSLDGWLVKIRRPKKSDRVGDVASFYCRKGFYAVNVQAIVNKNKLVLWRSIKCRGGGANMIQTRLKKQTCIRNYLKRQKIFENWDYILLAIQHIQFDLFCKFLTIMMCLNQRKIVLIITCPHAEFGLNALLGRSTCVGEYYGGHFNLV